MANPHRYEFSMTGFFTKTAVRFYRPGPYQRYLRSGPHWPRIEETTMRRLILTAFVWSVGGVALADPENSEDKKRTRDALPRESAVKWDVQVLEDGPTYTVVKREVKGNKVTWVLENKRNLGTEITFGYQAAMFDE